MKNLLSSKRFQLGFNFFRENSRSHQRGFTLIELLIVVAIISVLVSVGAFSYSTAMRNARDTQRKSDLKKIALALEKYYSDNGRYPPLVGVQDITSVTTNPNPWIAGLTTNYLSEIPRDPKNSGSNLYRYISFNNGQNYIILTDLENDRDDDRRVSSTDSPCNEAPYLAVPSSYIDPASYDWCVSDPK